MRSGIVYPASMTCEIIPEYKNDFDPDLFDHKENNFNLLDQEDEYVK